jgi:DNA-binding FadR family transcriptional regulator
MPRLVAADLARTLKQRIDAGEWGESRRVPPERDLASGYGVARNTVRRAMTLLEDEGVVVRHVGRGTFVSGGARPSMTEVIRRIEGASPADMMEIRLLLEPAAAAFAAADASVEELASMQEAHRLASAAVDMRTFENWDTEFHHRIFACSRNDLLREIHNLLRILRNQSQWFEMKKRSFSEERRATYCREHGAIVDAISERDPDGARSAMEAHLRSVAANLLGR